MISLKKLLRSCDRCCDCFIWRGASSDCNHPRIGKVSTRRMAWVLAFGEIPKGLVVTVTCENSMCINPRHMELITRTEVLQRTTSRIDVKARMLAAKTRFSRANYAKITMELARQIRASDKSGVEWARHLGVSSSLISLIRTGKSWKEPSFWRGLA